MMPNYKDGGKVRSDIPAILTLGAQYAITDRVRAMAGFHYYWDKDAKGTPIKKGDNTWEATLGLEWDVNDKILLSAGTQRTQYGFDDADMSDINFNINSTALCIGGAYKFNEKMKLNVGYMHSFYGEHEVSSQYGKDIYTRKNDVIGASLDITF
jgi:long-subunit fatty acid transport protein